MSRLKKYKFSYNIPIPPRTFAERVAYCKKREIAQKPSTPVGVLTKLAKDEDGAVRSYVAANPSTSPGTLAYIAKDEDWRIRYYVASNPSTPPAVLSRLLEDSNRHVREHVAANLSTPPETLTRLAEDEETGVRKKATQNPIYLQHRAVQDGVCEPSVKLPVEWLHEMYDKNLQ